jgi:hypothetical protein
MKQNQKRIQLDWSTLLGFKLAQSTPTENIGKYSQTKLGAKLGVKAGVKVGVRLA